MADGGSDLSVPDMFDMAEGKDFATIMKNGVGAWFVAVFGAAAAGFQEAVNFMFLPFRVFVDIATASIDAFILAPMGITEPAWQQTAQELLAFDVLAGPFAALLALAGLGIVLLYLGLPRTSNFLPGILVDNVIWSTLFTTPEEEEEGET